MVPTAGRLNVLFVRSLLYCIFVDLETMFFHRCGGWWK